MANSKELVQTNSVWSPGFTEELLPVSKQVSLLFHISYLCLAKFPNLERLLRQRAVETQLLFGSSEALLLKCMGTSQNLVSSLFPMLILAIEKQMPELAVRYLEKAKRWIEDIIKDVEKMVKSYVDLNGNVATTTSDIICEKSNTEKKIVQLSKEFKAMEDTLKKLDQDLATIRGDLEKNKALVIAKDRELESHVKDVTSKSSGLGVLSGVVPFIGPIIKCIYDAATAPGAAEKTRALQNEVNQLNSEKMSLERKEWNIQVQQIDMNLKMAKLQIDKDSIPSPVHLNEVQRYLTKIQQLLIQLKTFWEKVQDMLVSMQQTTFVNEDLVSIPKLQDEFVKSIQKASEIWSNFGISCSNGAKIFKIQSKDAYAFLEIDPSTLSEAVWQKEYDSVMAQLQQIKVFEAKPAAIQK